MIFMNFKYFNIKLFKYFIDQKYIIFIKLFKKKSYKREMKVIAIFALILISTTLGAVATTKQLECIAACHVAGGIAALSNVADNVKYIADGVKEASIIATGKCVFPSAVSDISVYCAFDTCYKKAYTVTSTAAKN
jgi:hypothetical protein